MMMVYGLYLGLALFQNNCYYVGDASTLCKRGAKESFKIFVNSRDTFKDIPVDEKIRQFLTRKTAA